MTPGLRTHKSATLRIAEPTGLPEDMRDGVREIVSLTSEDRGKGHAKALLWQVCAEADIQGKVLMLTVDPAPNALTFDQLKRFYGRFGFVEIQPEPCLMARRPEPARVARTA